MNFSVQLSECSCPDETGRVVVVVVVLMVEGLAEGYALACRYLEAVLVRLASVLAAMGEEEHIRVLVQDCEEDKTGGKWPVVWELNQKLVDNRWFDVSAQGMVLTYHVGHSLDPRVIQARLPLELLR